MLKHFAHLYFASKPAYELPKSFHNKLAEWQTAQTHIPVTSGRKSFQARSGPISVKTSLLED